MSKTKVNKNRSEEQKVHLKQLFATGKIDNNIKEKFGQGPKAKNYYC